MSGFCATAHISRSEEMTAMQSLVEYLITSIVILPQAQETMC